MGGLDQIGRDRAMLVVEILGIGQLELPYQDRGQLSQGSRAISKIMCKNSRACWIEPSSG